MLAVLLCGCTTSRVTVPLLPPFFPSPSPPVLWTETFDELHPEQWREVEVHGRTAYQAITIDGRRCLQAESRAAASVLLHSLRFDP